MTSSRDETPHTLPLQPASEDIWNSKYRLHDHHGNPVDADVDASLQRVARTLAEVEAPDRREYWHERFLRALRQGAVPAGRIMSNAGAVAYKPATSLINCTVSGTVRDSMNDILLKVHEAGLTLKAGCGIGYSFSTLRPRGAYVAGAGSNTSGPLSFMDIYDKMCFTVASAGGRRGAQMATFDVSHPDVRDFIRAKREDGRLRQFNLSLLINDAFMQAVRSDASWPLVFPVHAKEVDGLDFNDPDQVLWREWPTTEGYIVREDGLVACKVYSHVRARHLWNMIMTSTYDYAEPGFILIDRVNEMNNNWWCEDIQATNPCVTADLWTHTSDGPRQVRDLIGRPFLARVDGVDHATGANGFFQTATRPVLALETLEGYRLRLTADHPVRRVTQRTPWHAVTEWCAASQLKTGDQVLLNDHRANAGWAGALDAEQGYLLGWLVGDGTLSQEGATLAVWPQAMTVNGAHHHGTRAVRIAARRCGGGLAQPTHPTGESGAAEHDAFYMTSGTLRDLAFDLGMQPGRPVITPALERASSDAYCGFLRGLFDANGRVLDAAVRTGSVHLTLTDAAQLAAVQRMLLRLGIPSRLHCDASSGGAAQPDPHGVTTAPHHQAPQELVIAGGALIPFAARVGFTDSTRLARLSAVLAAQHPLQRADFVATVAALIEDGIEAVYDVQVPGIHTFDANGLHAHNCGEQPLPEYGACLLGSINLTQLVRRPFTPQATFDWDAYRDLVGVFTRMLDNVVELNGLVLPRQREEIMAKRRHGMGFFGLGSTLTMLNLRYGTPESVAFTREVSKAMAIEGWRQALALAHEKGPAPVLTTEVAITEAMLRKRPEMRQDGYTVGDRIRASVLHARYSRYMQRIAAAEPELVRNLEQVGARFTHHSSIAPTGTISLSFGNNASNGIEPSFAHLYSRNVIRVGRKTKEKVDVVSYELLLYRHLIDPTAAPGRLPPAFVTADDIAPREHVDIQAAAQEWIDSSISKTANVPTDYPYEQFKDIYLYAHERGLKGCTTFRFNPAAFQGVLVKESDLENTRYQFTLDDGSVVEFKGNDDVEYDGEVHTAANLFDALKEGYYGRL